MAILNTLLEISIFSGIIFAVTILIKKCFRNKMSPFLHFALWGVLILRLLIPVTFEAPLHIFSYSSQSLPVAVQSENVPQDTLELPSAVATATEKANRPIVMKDTSKTMAQTSNNASPAAPAFRLSATQILLIIWLSGIAAGLIHIAGLTRILTRKIKRKLDATPAWLLSLLEEVKYELGIKAKLNIKCQYEYGTPALLFPNTILIPVDMLAALDNEKIKNCLRHECTHFKRGDQYTSLLISLLSAVYWFNPFLWLAFHEIRKDMETACDSAVVKHMKPSARRDYAVLILDLCANARNAQIVLGMAQSSTKKVAEQRIRGVFMENKSRYSVKLLSLLISAVLVICCFTTACQPTPEKPVIVNNNKDLVEEVQNQPSPSVVDESHKLKNIVLPETHYTYTSENENASLTINVDAQIVKPDAEKMPFARVTPMEITQEMVTGMFNYLFPDKKPYLPRTQLTKDEIQEQILHFKKTLSKGTVDGDPMREEDKEWYNKMISDLEEDLKTAPEVAPDRVVSDGTLQKVEENGKTYNELNVSLDESDWLHIRTECNDFLPIWYCHTDSTFSTDGMVKFDEGDELPEAVQKHLTLPLSDAVAKADGFFAAAGIDDVKLFSSYLVDNHGTGHVDDNWDPASEYAYKLFYTRTVNGVPVSCHMSGGAGGDYSDPWFYESIEFTISDNGILEIKWVEPCAVSEIIDDDVDLIDFDQAVRAFESAATYTFGNFIDENENVESSCAVNIDSIQLNLVRLREKDKTTEKAGLYVPAYVFYGSVKEKTYYKNEDYTYEGYRTSMTSGNDFYPGPLMVMAINAVDGSLINVMDAL